MKEMKIDDVKVEKEKKAQEPAPHVKAAQIEKEAVRALSVDEAEEAPMANTFGGSEKIENKIIEVPDGTPHEMVEELVKHRSRIEVLKAECIDLKEENRQLKDSNVQTNNQLRVRDQELIDAKKTISKMQQAHEAEVQDLKDQLGETQAALDVAEKSKADACRERNELIDAAADDDDRFQEILALAVVLERGARSMQELSRMLQEKTER